MSWKSLITAGLLCILASPAFGAAAPQLEVINDGLDANGNWVWYVRVAPSDSGRTNDPDGAGPQVAGTTMAVELGFRSNSGSPMTAASNNATGVWDTSTPGKTIFGWETKYQYQGSGTTAPEGIESYCGTSCGQIVLTNGTIFPSANPNPTTTADTTIDTGTSANGERTELFVALGSANQDSGNTTTSYAITNATVLGVSNATGIAQGTQMLKIITKGPSTAGSLSASLTLLGSHGTSSNEGRIAEITTGTAGSNYKGFTGTASISVLAGDVNLSGNVSLADLNLLGNNFGQNGGKHWQDGDINGDGNVSLADLNLLGNNFGQSGGSYSKLAVTGTVDTGAGASLEGAGVPEPASIALLGLAMLGGLGLMRRRT